MTLIQTYDDLIKALSNVRTAKGMSCIDLEERSGLQSGYVGKLENCFSHNRARSARFMGPVSFGLWLQGLGIGLKIVDAKQQKSAGAHSVKKANEIKRKRAVAGKNRQLKLTASGKTKLAKRAAKFRMGKMTPEARSESARHAANARWSKPIRLDPPQ
jgi:hypothetical protein